MCVPYCAVIALARARSRHLEVGCFPGQEIEQGIVRRDIFHRIAVMYELDLAIRPNDEDRGHSSALEDLALLGVRARHLFVGVQQKWIPILDYFLVKLLACVFLGHEYAEDHCVEGLELFDIPVQGTSVGSAIWSIVTPEQRQYYPLSPLEDLAQVD